MFLDNVKNYTTTRRFRFERGDLFNEELGSEEVGSDKENKTLKS